MELGRQRVFGAFRVENQCPLITLLTLICTSLGVGRYRPSKSATGDAENDATSRHLLLLFVVNVGDSMLLGNKRKRH